ncbi:MAG: four helix bundle protein [Kiritimatiellaeota bacterium]|nr:four helix bundle protein [Kiritimatiellota bacterium]
MREHERLRAFELADQVALRIYKITSVFPQSEVYGLSSQMRRAALSIPSNIVEGCARSTQQEYRRFLDIAFGSLKELTYQFSLALRLDYIQPAHITNTQDLLAETEKVLSALIRSLQQTAPSSPSSPPSIPSSP